MFYPSAAKNICLPGAVILVLVISLPCALAQGAGYWHTAGSQILDSNNQTVRIAGVNWYGFETTDEIAHGLWAQDYHTILSEIKSNGFNIIRIPFSNQMVETPEIPTNFSQNNGQPINTDLVGLNSLQILDKIVTAAGADGLRIILDNHRSEAGNSNEANGLWYTSSYPESAWINDWKTLATRYQSFTDANGNPIVIGMDLRNEPHLLVNGSSTGACWTGDTSTSGCPTTNTAQNWPAAATRAANAIQAINSNLLIFVEGNDCYSGSCGWQGGNLEGVASNPVTLSVANHLVYSAHDYGPNLFAQPWFNSSTTLDSLEAVWNQFWAYISAGGTAPVWVGEFGTDNTTTDIENTAAGSQGQWFQSLITFLQDNPNLSWTYWALNGEDTYAILNSQYSAVVSTTKLDLLATIQFPLGSEGTPNFNLAATPASLSLKQGASGTSTITITALNSFAEAVSFTASGLPSGVTASFNPATTTTSGANSVLTLAASSTATAGRVTVTVTGTSGSLTHTTTIALTVNPTAGFTLAPSAASLSVEKGSSATDTISVTDVGGFTGSVTLAASGLPKGVTATFGTNPTTGSSVLRLTASSTVTSGSSRVTITGTSGSTRATTTIALTVNPISQFACDIDYTIDSQWPGGFGAAITINNTGTTAITNWTLTWAFANGQTVTELWNGQETQSGANVTVTNMSYNGSIPAGGSYNGMGFNGTWNNTTNAAPATFAVNGTTCN